jgi:hypothetical protein
VFCCAVTVVVIVVFCAKLRLFCCWHKKERGVLQIFYEYMKVVAFFSVF